MDDIRTCTDLKSAIKAFRDAGKTIALVPTMGALHNGHMTLVEHARQYADIVVMSIFVNPTQFGPNEDFDAYPRDEKKDIARMEGAGVDVAWMPSVEEMYPLGFSTAISVRRNADILCGAHREGHFDGVATVVSKLLLQTMPDIAVFGQKDFQQLYIIKRLVADINIPISIIGAPIAREDDGLALSSRNAYLSEEDRCLAPELFATLSTIKRRIEAGSDDSVELLAWGKEHLLEKGFDEVDYLELRQAETLDKAPIVLLSGGAYQLFVAARLGKTRLIDNLAIDF